MRRAIIHIGMPRTGSTSTQELLAQLRPGLAEVGLCYPKLAPLGLQTQNAVNHQPLAEALDGRRPASHRDLILRELSRELGGTTADTVILSYEDFALQKPRFRVPELLADILRRHGFAMEVALVVKPQVEQLNSAYGLRLQVLREARSYRDFARVFWWSGWFDYPARLEPWRVAAEERVTAVPFRDRRSDAPLLERVIAALGLAERLAPLTAGIDLDRAANRSPGPVASEASRRLRERRAHSGFGGHLRLIGTALDEAARARGLDQQSLRGNAPEIEARMMAHFAPANDRFAATVWGEPWARVVAMAPERAPNELAAGPIPPEAEAQVEAVMRAVIDQFGLRAPPRWWSAPVNLGEDLGERLARRLGYSRWRVV